MTTTKTTTTFITFGTIAKRAGCSYQVVYNTNISDGKAKKNAPLSSARKHPMTQEWIAAESEVTLWLARRKGSKGKASSYEL